MDSLVVAHPDSMAPLDPRLTIGQHGLHTVRLMHVAAPFSAPSSLPHPQPASSALNTFFPSASTYASAYTSNSTSTSISRPPPSPSLAAPQPSVPVQSSAVFTRASTPAPAAQPLSASSASVSLSQSANASQLGTAGVTRITSASVDLRPRAGSSLGYFSQSSAQSAAPPSSTNAGGFSLYSIPPAQPAGLAANSSSSLTQSPVSSNSYTVSASSFQQTALTRNGTSPALFSSGQFTDSYVQSQAQQTQHMGVSLVSQSPTLAGQPQPAISPPVATSNSYIKQFGVSFPLPPASEPYVNSGTHTRRPSEHQQAAVSPVSASSDGRPPVEQSSRPMPMPVAHVNGLVLREVRTKPPAAPGARRGSRVQQMANQIERESEPCEQEFRQRRPSFSDLLPLEPPPAPGAANLNFTHDSQRQDTDARATQSRGTARVNLRQCLV